MLTKIASGSLRLLFVQGSSQAIWRRSLSIVPFKLADIGEGIAEVELMKWFIKVQDFRI
jgi:hypothetical protein